MSGPEGLEGILLAEKPAGPSSHDVVRAARRALGTRRVGHAGTLDPFATGLLVLLVGRATRLAEYASGLDKTYRADLRLGASSTTGDPEGEIAELQPAPAPPPATRVRDAVASFVGELEQVPPAFSAVRLAGERAYHMARRGATFTLAPRRVRVHAIEVLAYAYPLLRLRVVTGPGVYVRSLARDLGEALGSAAYLRELQRESIGPFSVQDAVDVTAVPPSDVVARLLPAECAVAHLPALEVDAEAAEALVQGRRVPGPATAPVVAGPLRMIGPGGFLGVGVSVRGELRSLKVLHPERCRP